MALIMLCTSMLFSCGGLDPADVPPAAFIEGNVTFVGGSSAWPDSNVVQVLVVAFEEQPIHVDSILASLLAGKASLSDTLPGYSDVAPYQIEVTGPPRKYEYLVVAMQNGPSILTDWLMISVYAPSGDPAMPGMVLVKPAETVEIDFIVDFDNLPPQPFD